MDQTATVYGTTTTPVVPTTISTVTPLSIDNPVALPPPPYATALAYPKADETQQPPRYQYQSNLGNPVIVYIDDGLTSDRCLNCGGTLKAEVSYCALFCIIFTVILTFPFGLVLLCCLPCIFHRKCTRCGDVW